MSFEEMMILARARRKLGDKLGDMCYTKPRYLLRDFYSVDMKMSSDALFTECT